MLPWGGRHVAPGAASAAPGDGAFFHEPVLLAETVDLLDPRAGERFVDGTVGGGGHARALAERVGADGVILGIDRDPTSLARARETLDDAPARVILVRGSYADLPEILGEHRLERIDGLLLDLGICSRQVDDPERGFSFLRDGPLDLRFDPHGGVPAREVVRKMSEDQLVWILRVYGEEPAAGRIAAAMVRASAEERLETTAQLADVVESVVPRRGRRHPATRVFQALRIHVNDELGALGRGLGAAARHLATGGRLAVISYHSLEDRMAKRFFAGMERPCVCGPEAPVCVCGRRAAFHRRVRRAVKPSDEEIAQNARARSARLRVAEKISEPTEAMIDDTTRTLTTRR